MVCYLITSTPTNFSSGSSLSEEQLPYWGTCIERSDCNRDGGVWPTGEPTPTRTWSRAEDANCWSVDGYTSEDLNMRRKAETLQHRNNNAGWTKKDRYAYYAKRSKTVSNGASAVAEAKARSCANKPIQNFPASASNVPGRGSLFLDRSVPLTGWRWQRVFKAGSGQNTMFTFDYRNQSID